MTSRCTSGSPPVKCTNLTPLRFKMSQADFASASVTECRFSAGRRSRAKLQKPQRALHALVIAKWQIPGPPSQTARSAIFQIAGRSDAISSIASYAWQQFLVVDRIANDRAGHAVPAAAPSAELGADDCDHLNSGLAEQRIGVG